jgi:uncharacterized protein
VERQRHAPERMCVGCRLREPKARLLRVVRGADGIPRLDRTGGAEGRGAYVHADGECLRLALRPGGFPRALRVGAEPGWTASLVDELGTLIPEPEDSH